MSGNCQNGIGTFEFDDGIKYVGEFKDTESHGKGTAIFPDGTKYVGDWLDGYATGKGAITYADGDKYVGEFKDSERHGKGVLTYADGTTKTGIWEYSRYFGTEAAWEAEQTERKLAEERERVAEENARKKYERIYNACLIDKGKEVDMSVLDVRNAVKATCKDIAEDPSWWEELKYD